MDTLVVMSSTLHPFLKRWFAGTRGSQRLRARSVQRMTPKEFSGNVRK
jgi:hypothetical protein